MCIETELSWDSQASHSPGRRRETASHHEYSHAWTTQCASASLFSRPHGALTRCCGCGHRELPQRSTGSRWRRGCIFRDGASKASKAELDRHVKAVTRTRECALSLSWPSWYLSECDRPPQHHLVALTLSQIRKQEGEHQACFRIWLSACERSLPL